MAAAHLKVPGFPESGLRAKCKHVLFSEQTQTILGRYAPERVHRCREALEPAADGFSGTAEPDAKVLWLIKKFARHHAGLKLIAQ